MKKVSVKNSLELRLLEAKVRIYENGAHMTTYCRRILPILGRGLLEFLAIEIGQGPKMGLPKSNDSTGKVKA